MYDPKLLRRLGRVDVPALLLWGESDRIVTPAYGAAYAEAFADGRLQVIPEAGHLPQLEQPGATFAAIDGYLRDAIRTLPRRGRPRRPQRIRAAVVKICGSNEPSRSRGTSRTTGPTSVTTVFERVPLRVLPEPAFSCFSCPRWSVISPSRADSRIRFVNCCSRPPWPVSLIPSALARSTS